MTVPEQAEFYRTKIKGNVLIDSHNTKRREVAVRAMMHYNTMYVLFQYSTTKVLDPENIADTNYSIPDLKRMIEDKPEQYLIEPRTKKDIKYIKELQ